MMKIIRVADALAGGKKAYEIIAKEIAQGANVLGLATGSSPITLYQEMIASDLDFSKMTSVNLDEYVGLDAKSPQSYRSFMNDQLFSKKPFKESFVPNGKASDIPAECARYDKVIADHPIDVQVLGIGRNGHIGFNEPGTPFTSTTHEVQLTESTIAANTRFFDNEADVPTKAISMGIASIMKSKKIILLAYGVEKAEAILGTVNGAVTDHLPASVLQNHPDVTVIIDDAAGSLLK